MFKTDLDIDHIGTGLCARTLPKSEWTHAAHVAAAVWMLEQHGTEAERLMPDMIRRYNRSVGTPNTDHEGYHHTITLASLRAIAHAAGKGTLLERTNRVLAAGFDRPDWLFRYYRKETLFSVKARREWVAPDLTPLPSEETFQADLPAGPSSPGSSWRRHNRQ